MSIQGIANSRCSNYKQIIRNMEISGASKDQDLCEILKTVTSVVFVKRDESVSESSDEQMNMIAFNYGSSSTEELTKYLSDTQGDVRSLNLLDSLCPEKLFMKSEAKSIVWSDYVVDYNHFSGPGSNSDEMMTQSSENSSKSKNSVGIALLKQCDGLLTERTEYWPANSTFTVENEPKFQNMSTKSDGQFEYLYTLTAIVESTSQDEPENVESIDKLRDQRSNLKAIPECQGNLQLSNKARQKCTIRDLKMDICRKRVERLHSNLPFCGEENLYSETTTDNSISESLVSETTAISSSDEYLISNEAIRKRDTTDNSKSATTAMSSSDEGISSRTKRQSFLDARKAIAKMSTESTKSDRKTQDSAAMLSRNVSSTDEEIKPRKKKKLQTKRQRNKIAEQRGKESKVESGNSVHDEDGESVRYNVLFINLDALWFNILLI